MSTNYTKNKVAYYYDERYPARAIPPPDIPSPPFQSCGECTFASHGFLCYRNEGDCLKTQLAKINNKSRRAK